MNTTLPTFTESEAMEVRTAAGAATEQGGQELSLHELFSRWDALVSQVERIYKLTTYDYTNALTVRDRLERVTSLLSAHLRETISRALEPIDQRFKAATVESAKPLRDDPHFWWRRIPRNRDAEFDETL